MEAMESNNIFSLSICWICSPWFSQVYEFLRGLPLTIISLFWTTSRRNHLVSSFCVQVEASSTAERLTRFPLFCKELDIQPLAPSLPTPLICSTGPTPLRPCLQTTTSSPHTPPPFSRQPPPSRPSPASATASLPLLLPFKDHLSPCLASLLWVHW